MALENRMAIEYAMCSYAVCARGDKTTRTTSTCAMITGQLLICHYKFHSNWGWGAIIRPPTTGYVAHTLATVS